MLEIKYIKTQKKTKIGFAIEIYSFKYETKYLNLYYSKNSKTKIKKTDFDFFTKNL